MDANQEPAEPAAEDGPSHEFTLVFTAVECECGQEHEMALSCACGATAEPDPHVEDRRRYVAPLRVALAGPSTSGAAPIGPLDPFDWRDDLSAALTDVLDGVHLALDGDVAPLDTACRRLAELRASAKVTPRYRPHVEHWRATEATLAHLEEAASCYLDALSASTRDEAVDASVRAQRAIDTASATMAEFNAKKAISDRCAALWQAGDDVGALLAAAESAAERAGLLSLGSPGGHGAELYRRVTGVDPVDPACARVLVMYDLQAEVLCDLDRFWTVAQATYRRLFAKKADPSTTFADPEWQADMVALHNELVDAGRDIREMTFSTDRTAARNSVRIGALLVERVAKNLLATVLSAKPGKDYSQLRTLDIGNLIGQIEDRRWGDMLYGIDKALRHGDAHKEYVIEADGVRFTADKREYDFLTWDELTDHVLAAFESVTAMLAGTLCAASKLGIDVTSSFSSDVLGLSAQDAMRMGLAALGCREVTASIDGTSAAVAAIIPHGVFHPGLQGALILLGPAEVDTMTVSLTCDDGRSSVWSGPTEPLRRHDSLSAGPDREAAFLEHMARWSEDGDPFLGTTHLRLLVARQLEEVAGEAGAGGRLSKAANSYRMLAVKLDDDELASALKRLVRGMRLQATSGDGERDVSAALGEFERFLREGVALGPVNWITDEADAA